MKGKKKLAGLFTSQNAEQKLKDLGTLCRGIIRNCLFVKFI